MDTIMKITYQDTIFELQHVIRKNQDIEVWKGLTKTDRGIEDNLLKLIKIPKNVNEKIILDESLLLKELTRNDRVYDMVLKIEYTFLHHNEDNTTVLVVVYEYQDYHKECLREQFPEGEICNYYDFMRIAKMLIKTLTFLHLNGRTHNDICPENVHYNKETGFTKLMSIRDTIGSYTQIFYAKMDLKYTAINLIEKEELASFDELCEGDIWGYALTMFRVANGYDYIHADTTGGIIKALHTNQFKESRHPNEKINDFLDFVLEKDPKKRPTAFGIMNYLERKNVIQGIDVIPFHGEYVITNRVIESMNFEQYSHESSERQTQILLDYLLTVHPLAHNRYSNDRVNMLAEFFNIQTSQDNGYNTAILINILNNKLTTSKKIMSLSRAWKMIEMCTQYMKIKDKTKFRKKLLDILEQCKLEKSLYSKDLRTAWTVFSVELIDKRELFQFINTMIARFIVYLDE